MQLVEHRDRFALAAERLDDLVAVIHLLDMAIQLAKRSLLAREVGLRAFRDDRGDEMLSGSVTTTTRVSSGLMVSIIMMTPMTVTTEVINCVRLCCSVVLMLSMSLTARLRISPCVRES